MTRRFAGELGDGLEDGYSIAGSTSNAGQFACGKRWSPSFGQPDSGVKVDTMRFDRLLSLWGWFPLRHPLTTSGGTRFSCG